MFSGPAYVNDCSQHQLFPFSMNCITPCFGIITGVISSAQSDPSAQTPLSYPDFFSILPSSHNWILLPSEVSPAHLTSHHLRPALCVLVSQFCLTLCDPLNCSPPGSSLHGILQARVLEWVAISFYRGSSWPRDWTQVSYIAGRFFTLWATRKAVSWLKWDRGYPPCKDEHRVKCLISIGSYYVWEDPVCKLSSGITSTSGMETEGPWTGPYFLTSFPLLSSPSTSPGA